MNRPPASLTVLQAGSQNPGLAKLLANHQESLARLNVIQPLIAEALLPSVHCGPMDEDGTWCLLLSSNTTAAKIRQLVPAFEAQLRVAQLPVKSIRIRVLHPNREQLQT